MTYNQPMTTPRAAFWAGVRAEAPILLGTAPFGLIFGVIAVRGGVPPSITQAMSSIIFAGSAQFVAANLIGAGVPVQVIIVTVLMINLRHALYSASLAPYVKHLPLRWKWLLAYLLTDEAYAVAITEYQRPSPVHHKHWYFLGAGLALWSSWQASTAVGLLLGAQVPASWSLDFTLPLTFIALVVPALRTRADTAAALTAGILAVVVANAPLKLGLVIATICGIGVGLLLDRLSPQTVADEAGTPQEELAQ
jgi:4-azaleucine resistance transporter AzlC